MYLRGKEQKSEIGMAQTERQTDRQIDRRTVGLSQTHRSTGGQTDRHTNRQILRQADRRIDGYKDRCTDK